MSPVIRLLALSWTLACGGSPVVDSNAPRIQDLSASLSESIPTVVTVQWSTDIPTTGLVQFSEKGGASRSTPPSTDPTTEHEALLLGLAPDTEIAIEVQAEADGTTVSESHSPPTGTPPEGLVSFEQTGDATSWEGFQILATADGDPTVVIVNEKGQVVWWHVGHPDLTVFRGRLSVDGTSVIYGAEGMAVGQDPSSRVVRVPLDGGEPETLDWPYLKHDFVELEDGTLAALTHVSLDPEDENAPWGTGIMERAPDGTERVVWSIHSEPSPCGTDEELSHANALDWDAETGTYLVSMLIRSCLIALSRETGEILWTLGGDASDFDFVGDSTLFSSQHQFDQTADGVVIYDNGAAERNASRVVEYALDFETWEATEIWTMAHDPSFYGPSRGDVERLEDGLTRVVWDGYGEVQHLEADGTVTWQITTGHGPGLAYSTPLESFYRP